MLFGTDNLGRPIKALNPLISFAWRLVLVLTVSRILLVAWQWERVRDVDMFVPVFVQGLRFDFVLLGLALVIPVLLFPLFASSERLVPAWRAFLKVYLPAVLLGIVFMELSTPSFIDQFDSRPNILFVEYLDHPREVAATLWGAYKVPLILTILIVTGFTALSARQFRTIVGRVPATGLIPALAVTPFLLVLCLGLIRSTADHRPVNPSTVALSSDPLVNDLALSSAYTVLYSIYETRHESAGGFRYAKVDDEAVFAEVRAAMNIAPPDFTSATLPTLHTQQVPNPAARPKNLVIIIEESLGAEFVGALGGLDLTPNLDALAREGLWFTNLYATGTRSVRGLEAVVSGFTPTPARSVVKLGKSQRNFFTLAQLLGNAGYDTGFIYGGEAQFDNMRRFFMNNGFDKVIDKNDYDSPVFTGSWGVSDEDLFDRAHEEFRASRDRPFFSLVFTSTNHSPFQFPDGRIELYDEEKNTVNNAVKYADYALGRFIRTAQESDYWEDTVFLVVADHNSRVYGSEVVPIERFHIPGLILGGSISPGVFDPVASQIDLAPTLLSLIGVAAEHPMIGHDLTRTEAQHAPGRAIMQFNATQAYMEGDKVAVLQKDLPVRQFEYRDGQFIALDQKNRALIHKALAHAAWSSLAYEKSLYRLPADKEKVQRMTAGGIGQVAD
ncbi:MAG: LTA synthase family protein [Gammaproteobacteria bacterium]|nr:LTA synthase family protein [Gammaproteobacteria bacterium]MDH3362229.1 LTA synthase family protein [Gammaproteobacteria bacterium]MDH3480261.1 LTA synthase family protein [Gammaproteobacteria bacterium]